MQIQCLKLIHDVTDLAARPAQALFCPAMQMIMVRLEVKPERVNDFLELATYNATHSRKEPGNLRFDLVRSNTTPNRFALYEVYLDDAAVQAHMATPHYARWRAEVEQHLETPRISERFASVFPEPYS
jgi:(4S)-4-hydroxy-5-phosphonooxypentane-2,3-dione isomerase